MAKTRLTVRVRDRLQKIASDLLTFPEQQALIDAAYQTAAALVYETVTRWNWETLKKKMVIIKRAS